MALWNTVGDILQDSGWVNVLVEAEILSSGTADTLLKVAHLTKTRHFHQVTLLALFNLQMIAYAEMNTSSEISFEAWREDMIKRCTTFFFWDLIMRLQTLILLFVRAHREKDFSLYVEVLEELVPVFFALDHVNYAMWLPVHIRDMKSLPLSVREEFTIKQGWVVSKTRNKFSAIPIDQAHEQENRTVKRTGRSCWLDRK